MACIPLFSSAFHEVSGYIARLEAPYSLRDIRGFNELYKQAYTTLTQEEKHQIETFVDTMIERVERPDLASKIFGVV